MSLKLRRLIDEKYDEFQGEWGWKIDADNALAVARKRALLVLAAEMREAPTEQEAKLKAWLDTRPLKFRWTFQKPLHRYICDFCCTKARTILEIDGAHHREEYDARRDARLWAKGYQTLRFTNDEIEASFADVQRRVLAALEYEMARGVKP